MAYIPPHKRHSNESIKPSPPPNSVLRKSRMAHENRKDEDQKIVHPEDCIYKWFLQYSNGTEVDIPQCLQFAAVSTDSYKWTTKEKPLILMNGNVRNESNEVSAATGLRTPWVSVAESVEEDLLLGFERAKNRIEHGAFEALKMRLIARFGKSLFNGHPSVSIESQNDELVAESKLLGAKKWLHTDLPISYLENVKYVVVPKIGLQIEEVKDRYYVGLFDKARPESSFSCKCTLGEDKRLNMYKVERNFLRNVVVDVSCLDQNLDLRLTVDSKKISTAAQTDIEINYMKELINSAVSDSNVKGGLRWPPGKASSGNRFSVSGIWHMTTTSYSNSNIRLKVRESDLFDFETATGQAPREVFLILKGISTKLQEQKGEKGLITGMLKDVLKTIWEEFLPCDPFLT